MAALVGFSGLVALLHYDMTYTWWKFYQHQLMTLIFRCEFVSFCSRSRRFEFFLL